MLKTISITRLALITGAVVALTLFLASSAAHAEEDTIGADEYRISCLSCHGVGGRGNGPLAQFLTVKPTDSVEDAAKFLLHGRIHRALVVEHGQLKGIVTAFDLLRAFVGDE